ncbi:MAG: AbrB/MazE/SpoVT family DNA-binding domain-containing protein [Chloroflexia bacterium]|nr:AbrB/MazE/SpoVT family DNA-binding domain-containing protein [Chloroflexia bacterium]
MITYVRVTGSGQITIPAELRRKHNIATGDRLVVTEDDRGRIVVKPNSRTAADLDGKFHLLPGVEADDDLGNIVAEAREVEIERIMAQMNDENQR